MSNMDVAAISLVLLLALVSVAALHQYVMLEQVSTWCARRVLRSLRLGGVPTSIAFIMDGNRRWARARGRPAYEGHPHGGEKLSDILQWCLDAGIMTVTVYAFSIENFKRPQKEIDEIFSLAHDKVRAMLRRTDLVQRHKVRVNILGDLDRLPLYLRTAFADLMSQTRQYSGGPTLNICFAYTSRAEMARGVSTAVRLCDEGLLSPSDVDEALLSECLYTGYASGADPTDRHPQLLVRTSGETRLSDFLLFQTSNAILSFKQVLWPDITAWHLVGILLDYIMQANSSAFSNPMMCVRSGHGDIAVRQNTRAALSRAREEYFEWLSHLAGPTRCAKQVT